MNEQKGRIGKRILLAIRLAVVFAGLVWTVISIKNEGGFGRLIEVFKKLNFFVFVLALVLYLSGQVVVGLRWWILLRTQQIFIPLGAALRLFFLGLFYNNCMPGAVGGDLLRAWYVTKHTSKRFEAVLSVFIDRLVGLIGSIIIAIVFYFLLHERKAIDLNAEGGSLDFFSRYTLVLIWTASIIAIVVFLLFIIPHTRKFLWRWGLVAREQVVMLSVRLVKAAVLYCSKPLALLFVLSLTISLQIVTITGFWLIGKQIGVDVSLSYYLVFFTISWSIGMLPVSIGGLWLVEEPLAQMFKYFCGVGIIEARAVAFCQRIIWIIGSLPGAWIHLTGRHLPHGLQINQIKEENIQ